MDPNWVMVIITGVYVVATIFICIANIKSAKATKEQVEEAKKQFEENNRAYVTADFEVIRNGLLAIHITNHGKRVANDITVHICEEFISNIDEPFFAEQINRINHSRFTLGIGQSWYLSFGSIRHLEKLSDEKIKISFSYIDSKNTYNEFEEIDLKQYHWALLYESPLQDELQEIKVISKSIKSIDKSLKSINSKSIKCLDNETDFSQK